MHQIDALRGIAALLVAFVYHQHYLTGQTGTGPLASVAPFGWLHTNGWVMVDLFFVISGFIFARVYLATRRLDEGWKPFARARIARLYPLHLATLLAAAAIFAFGTPSSIDYARNDAWNFGLNLVMLQESGLQTAASFNLPSWSISVEVFCYFAFYLLATYLRRGFLPVAALVALAALLATAAESPTVDHVARGFCGFFAGVVAERFAGIRGVAIAFLALPAVWLLGISSGRFNMGAALGIGLFPLLAIVAQQVSFLTHPVLVWLGDRSYSIYLIHAPVYMAINVFIFAGRPIAQPLVWPAIATAWLTILALSDVSYRRFETPLRRRIGRRSPTAEEAIPVNPHPA